MNMRLAEGNVANSCSKTFQENEAKAVEDQRTRLLACLLASPPPLTSPPPLPLLPADVCCLWELLLPTLALIRRILTIYTSFHHPVCIVYHTYTVQARKYFTQYTYS